MTLIKSIESMENVEYQRNRSFKLRRSPGIGLKRVHNWLNQSQNLTPRDTEKTILTYFSKHGIGVCMPRGPNYPESLLKLGVPPKLLFFKGNLGHLQKPTVGIIGSRKASPIGLKLARGLGEQAALSGFSVVSGLAMGIDTAAIKGSVSASPSTPSVGVLGTAITQCYPANNYSLFRLLSQKGCLISEYPPWFKTRPYHFIFRNDIIAALSDVLIIVEAGLRSGTFHTIQTALELSKPIFVMDLPAPGNQKLIQEGAYVIRKLPDAFDLIFESLRVNGV